MAQFTVAVMLLLVVVTLCVSSAQKNDTIVVLCPRRSLVSARGSAVKLSCLTHYDFKECGLVHVVWRHLDKQNVELTDPDKYSTVVSEMIDEDNMRHRRVVTEILSLTEQDDGQFQCMAECETGETAMGRLTTITVKD